MSAGLCGSRAWRIVLANTLLELIVVCGGYYFNQHGINSAFSGQVEETFVVIGAIFMVISCANLIGIFYHCILDPDGNQRCCCTTCLKWWNFRVLQAAVMTASGTLLLIHIMRSKGSQSCDNMNPELCQWRHFAQGCIAIIAIIDGFLYIANWHPVLPKFVGGGKDIDDFDEDCRDEEKAHLERYASLSSSTDFNRGYPKASYIGHPNGGVHIVKDPTSVALLEDVVLRIQPQNVHVDNTLCSSPAVLPPAVQSPMEATKAMSTLEENVFLTQNEYFLPAFQHETSRASDADDTRYSTLIRQLRDSGIFG